MARTVKPEEFAAKRKAILDSAQRLVLTKGYDQMSVQDILADLQISGGAFHHYFESRHALLDALIERIQHESAKPLLPIVHDSHLTAIEKLQGLLITLDRLRLERKEDVIAALRVWYTEGNALVRQRVGEAIRTQRAPWLSEIIRQGLQQGVFSASFPEQSGEVVIALLQAMGDTHAQMLLSLTDTQDQRSASADAIVATHAAYMEAIERVLGAPPNSLYRATPEQVAGWVAVVRISTE